MNRNRGRFLCALGVAISIATSGSAAASDAESGEGSTRIGTKRVAGPHYEVSGVFGAGGPLAAPGMTSAVGLRGIHVLEHHGLITKFAMLVLGTVAAAGEKREYERRDTTYEYYKVSRLTAGEIAAGVSRDYVSDLLIYSPLFATSEGTAYAKGAEFRLARAWPAGAIGELPVVFLFGLQGAYVHASGVTFRAGEGPHGAASLTAAHSEKVAYGSFGLFGRFIVPLSVFAEAYAQWDANILSLARFFNKRDHYANDGLVYTSPFRVGVSFSPLERVFVRAEGSVNGFGTYALGWAIDAGVRL